MKVSIKVSNIVLFPLLVLCLLNSIQASAENLLFTVTPKNLTTGSTFSIRLPDSHPALFAVERPDKTWVYIVLDEPKYIAPKFENFSKSTLISINTTEFKGKSLNEQGELYSTNVFTKPGKYMFYVASNLQTEPENTDSIETYVQYSVVPK